MPNIVTSPRTILLRRLAEMGMSEEEFIEKVKVRLIEEDGYSEWVAGLVSFETEIVTEVNAGHYEAITGIPAKLWIEQTNRYDDYCLELLSQATEEDPLFMDKTLNPEKYSL